MVSGLRQAVGACVFALLVLPASPALAGPVVTLELGDGASLEAELLDFAKGRFKLRELDGARSERSVRESDVLRVDFGKQPIELNAAGAIAQPKDPEDTTRLWWAIDNRHFMVLLRSCLPTKDGPGFRRMRLLREQVREQSEKKDIAAERRRDLRLAMIVLAGARGQKKVAKEMYKELRRRRPDDPVVRNFGIDVFILVLEEARDRRGRPPGRRWPGRSGNEQPGT